MLIFLSIIVFVGIFGLIIFLHELGHFLVAKREGMRVKEFAFGFPPRLVSMKRGETRFSVNLIPLGGYVSILGEDEASTEPDSFGQQSPWARLRVILAGVTMNIILAWLLLTVWLWVAPLAPRVDAVAVAAVTPGSAAADAGIEVNDFILSADAQNDSAGTVEFVSDQALANFTQARRGDRVTFTIRRNGNERQVFTSLSADPEQSPLGVSIVDVGASVPNVPWWKAPWDAILEMGSITFITLKFVGALILKLFGAGSQSVSVASVSGPVGIFVFLKQTITLGAPFVLRYAALISLAVAIFNLLPFPALDGGRAIFLLYEGITGKRAIPAKTEGWIHTAGFALLILLIIVVTYFDLKKL